MKKVLLTIIILFSLSLNTFAIEEGYYKEQANKKILEEITKSESQIKKHITNGGICGEEKLYKDVIKGKEISINLIQKNIDSRYIKYQKQLDLYIKKEDELYEKLEEVKEDYEKADNLHDDYYARTGDYNYDLLRDSNHKYSLVNRKKKEIATLIKEYSEYIENFDKSDLEFYQNNKIIKSEIVEGITEKCLELKEEIKPKNKTSLKSTKKVETNETIMVETKKRTKLEIKQEKLRNKIIELHKKIPKKIEALYPKVLKYKKRLKKGTDKYALIETIEKTIYELMSK